MRNIALVLMLALAMALPGCSSRHMEALFSGLPSDSEAPFGGIAGPERDAWLGTLAPLVAESDLEELAAAFDEVPDGQTRSWINFDTQSKWRIEAQKPDVVDYEIRRALLVQVVPETGETVTEALAAMRLEQGKWACAKMDPAQRELLLRRAE